MSGKRAKIIRRQAREIVASNPQMRGRVQRLYKQMKRAWRDRRP